MFSFIKKFFTIIQKDIEMEIIIGKHAGFCDVAQRAITNSIESAKKEKIFYLGEIVHNENLNCL